MQDHGRAMVTLDLNVLGYSFVQLYEGLLPYIKGSWLVSKRPLSYLAILHFK